MRIRSNRDVWLFTAVVTLIAMLLSELAVLSLYAYGGRDAFHLDNAIVFAAVVPVLITVPITFVVARMSLRLLITQAELRHLANTDPLTRLPNRRSFFKAADSLLNDARRLNLPVALIVIDADHFKDLNDSFGHAAGDQALAAIADVMRESFREDDLICRVGGEEFAVLLPGLDVTTALPLAQRVVDGVAGNPIMADSAIIEYSVSCGIADQTSSYDLPTLFKAADDAMYLAKSQGRSRVVPRSVAA